MAALRFTFSANSTLLRRLQHTSAWPFSQIWNRSAIDSIPRYARAFSSSPDASKAFLDTVRERRSYYALNKESPISDAQLSQILKDTVLHVPSSFNSQSARLVTLLGAEHDKFWEIVKQVLRPSVPEEQFAGTVKKLDGFKAAYGTVCFFS